MIIAAVIMIIGYVLLYKKTFSNYSNSEIFWISLLYFYIWLVLFLTIIPKDFSLNPLWQSNKILNDLDDSLKPFNDFILSRPGSLTDISLNILMMVPFGYLLSKVLRVGWLKVVLVTLFFSVTIEGIQLLTTKFLIYHRFFDITDIINNTIGGFIGSLVYKKTAKTNEKFNK